MNKQILAILVILSLFTPTFIRAQSDINLTGYTQTFDDEFNTLSVTSASPKGASTWYYWPPYGAAGAFSESQWDVNAFSVSSGILSDKAWLDSSNNWHSGNLSSMDNTGVGFAQQYGYFEIRAQMPSSGTGAWPAFWLMTSDSIPSNAGIREEIDVFEWYGNNYTNGTDDMQEASHNWNADGSQNQTQPYVYSPYTPMPNGALPWQGYHIYGCQVDPVHITWYIDGVQTNQCATPTSYINSPFYMMIDYALGGGWPLTGMVNNSSLQVDWVRVYSLPSGGSAPAAPTGLGATAGNAQVSLSWTASSGATSYNVYRGTTAGGESTTAVATGIATTSYTGTGLTNGTTYYYKVAAVNSYGTSGYSNEAMATPTSGGGSGTTYYQDSFTRTGALTGSRPDVTDTNANTWSETYYGAVGGTVLAPNGTKVVSASGNIDGGILPVNGTSGVTLDGTKNFTLSADFVSGTSAYYVALFLGADHNGLAALQLNGGSSTSANGYNNGSVVGYGNSNYNGTQTNTLTLSYSATTGLITYEVNGTPISVYGGANTLAVTHAQLQALTNIGFEFEYDGANISSMDNFTLVITPPSGGNPPAAPTGLGATAGNAQVSLSWTASSGATSYNVYRGTTAGGESTTAVATGITTTSYTGTGLTNGTTYYYKVAAVNNYGTSSYSNEAMATPTSGATTYYQDSFTRTGALTGSKPDVTDTNNNTWAETYYGAVGGTVLAPNGTKVVSASGNIDGGILPVNGTSGVVLDGTKNFTLSADFVSGTSSYYVALFLGGDQTGLAALQLNSGTSTSANGLSNGNVIGYGNSNYNGTQTNTLTLSYSTATGLITYEVNGTPISVYGGANTLAVTHAQLQALTNIGFEFEYDGANISSMDNFTLTVH